MWGGVLNDKLCGNSVYAQWDKNTSFLVSFQSRNIDFNLEILIDSQKKSITFALNRSQKEFFLKRFIPKAYDSCIEKKTKTQKNWHDLSDCGKKFRADFYFSKKGDNELDFGKLFFVLEKK